MFNNLQDAGGYHDLRSVRFSDDLAELFFYNLRSGSRMQMLDDLFQPRNFDALDCQLIRSRLFS